MCRYLLARVVPRSVLPSSAAVLCSAMLLLALLVAPAAQAQVATNGKIAPDLARAAASVQTSDLSWVRETPGGRLAKVLVVASSDDPKLTELRRQMVAAGGLVHYSYLSVRAVAGLLPVAAPPAVAARSDVLAILPNRSAARSGSLLQDSTGASLALRAGTALPLDGAGVGIAVLDSGIDFRHRNFQDAAGKRRVVATIDIAGYNKKIAKYIWQQGVDLSDASNMLSTLAAWMSNSEALASYAPRSSTATPDAYGHGTHVASIAAGNGAFQQPDSSGIAPGATLFDVRVLDEQGTGNLADVLAGMDLVLQLARRFNIQAVDMGLTLTESSQQALAPWQFGTRDDLEREPWEAIGCGTSRERGVFLRRKKEQRHTWS